MRPLLRFLAQQAWAMEAQSMQRMVEIFNRHLAGVKLSGSEIEAAIGRDPADDHAQSLGYSIQNGIAVVPIRGIIAKYSSDVNGTSQPQGTSAEQIQMQLHDAEAQGVRCIVLAIDSPGGMVAGTPDTASLIAEIAERRHVVAMIEDCGCSAAYYLACGASEIYANQNAMVGSIGVISMLIDSSKAHEAAGYKVHVLRSVDLKAPGQDGEPITDAQVAACQANINAMHALFAQAVCDGREFTPEQLASVATGEVWIGAQAQERGLIDGITTMSDLLSALTITNKTPQGKTMKISAEVLGNLLETYPGYEAQILKAAKADGNQTDITAQMESLKAADAIAKQAQIQAQNAALVKEVGDLKTSVATKDATIATLTSERDEALKRAKTVADIGAKTPESAGGQPDEITAVGNTEEAWRAAYKASPTLREKFGLGEEAYVGHMKYEAKKAAKAAKAAK